MLRPDALLKRDPVSVPAAMQPALTMVPIIVVAKMTGIRNPEKSVSLNNLQNQESHREQMSEARYRNMTESPVGHLVVTLGIPSIISMLMTNLYNLADTTFVGRLDTSASGAIGIVFSYMVFLQAVGFMFGQGSGSKISRSLGERDPGHATRIASTGFLSAVGFGLLFGAGSLLFLDPLLRFLGSTETILPYARDYIRFIAAGAPFIVGSFVLNNILRYEGLARKAMAGLVTGAVLNIFLDPLFIFVLKMGTAGAGLATALSQLASFCILLSIFLRGKTQSRILLRSGMFRFREMWDIIALGSPSLIRQACNGVAAIFLNHSAALYGDAAVAAMAIVGRVSHFTFAIGVGLGQGYQPVAGFNYGARKWDRLRAAYRFTLMTSLGVMFVSCLALLFPAEAIVRFFRDDPAVVAIGTPALRYAAVALMTQPVAVLANMTLQATGKALEASILAMLRSGLYFVPILLLFEHAFGVVGIELAQPVADVLSMLTSIPFILIFFRRLGCPNKSINH